MSHSTTSVNAHNDWRIMSKLKDAVSEASPEVMSNVVRILRECSDHFGWVGIYLVQGNSLVLAAYAGDAETQHKSIPIGRGICGLAASRGETVVVPDVSKDSRYLMCFPSTRSEIVVPIKSGSKVLGEIDIDSDRLSAFTQGDRRLLEKAAATLAAHLEKNDSSIGSL